ncbi:DeoR/GlpR family DNA-binding transcription regulator [Cohaesibacter celericrescens]|uniref:DeoR family transcriptional regulator n=1 Tax=Cohaesibacter celericrescens TaxID=2067669 RepID=A0A2N5XQI6_9HYPH|nr:DeoR/GlpR family DNA-binding transcription regulator [Cohaesibacter celericrescens]PLW76688.1 DeoR family transcriptional regulator [Cohaesibacter celericrescens]
MEALIPRHQDILDIAKREGRVDVDGLADTFDVTPQTIRKDLNYLCDKDRLERVHGGAIYPSGVTNYAYESRRMHAALEKEVIGKAAAQLIPDNASLILNIGTTTEQVARALVRHDGLMVITNNINVANILHELSNADVVVAGGMLRKSDGGLVGEATIDFIEQFKVDFAVIGVSAIDADGSLLDYDYREVRISQTILQHARKTILVSDSMKFERNAPVRIGHLSDIDIFVVDKTPSEEIQQICRDAETQIVVASPSNSEHA